MLGSEESASGGVQHFIGFENTYRGGQEAGICLAVAAAELVSDDNDDDSC